MSCLFSFFFFLIPSHSCLLGGHHEDSTTACPSNVPVDIGHRVVRPGAAKLLFYIIYIFFSFFIFCSSFLSTAAAILLKYICIYLDDISRQDCVRRDIHKDLFCVFFHVYPFTSSSTFNVFSFFFYFISLVFLRVYVYLFDIPLLSSSHIARKDPITYLTWRQDGPVKSD